MSCLKILSIQQKYLNNFIYGNFNKHLNISKQIFQIILSFLFSSPYRQKNVFILKQGGVLLKFKQQRHTSLSYLNNKSFLMDSNHQQFTIHRPFIITQNDQFMISTKYNHNQRIHISKMWLKPATRTQKKILTYCVKFKQFLLGKHHLMKTIDLRFLNREFLIPHDQKDIFQRDFKNVQQNDINLCSYDVLDSYMNLIQRNYIEVQVQMSQQDSRERVYKVISDDPQSDEIFSSVKLIFNHNNRIWMFNGGDKLVIWKKGRQLYKKYITNQIYGQQS